jgi:HSP20 family protein
MDPMKKLRSELGRDISRAWESLTEGWCEVLTRGTASLTRFARASQSTSKRQSPDFPQWALLAGECWETAHSVIVRLELPGMRKEDIDVSIHAGRLQIRGEKRSSGEEEETRHYFLMERAFGRFERSIPLPANIDAARAEVSYQDGIVTVILPKSEPVPPTQLSIK